MANDLTTPLTGRKRKSGARRHLPIARTLFALLAVIAVAFVLRLILTDDPNGGRPSEEVAITSTRNSNEVANAVSEGPVTITADPQQFPAGSSITAVPAPTAGSGSIAGLPDLFGALPDLSEETGDGRIPRISATGQTPFATYSRPADTAAAGNLPKVAIIVTGLARRHRPAAR